MNTINVFKDYVIKLAYNKPLDIAAILIIIMLLLQHITLILTILLGICYPGYKTVKLLNLSNIPEEEFKELMTYWLFFSILVLLDIFLHPVVRLILIIFLLFPWTGDINGSIFLYNKIYVHLGSDFKRIENNMKELFDEYQF